jgi:putative transposase
MLGMSSPAATKPPYAGYRFPAEVISHAVWLYFRFPLALRMVEELLAARGIIVSHETIRQWVLKFGRAFANQIRRRLPRTGDKWHLDEVVIKIAGVKHCFGARWISPGWFSTCWCKADATRRPPSACCASC